MSKFPANFLKMEEEILGDKFWTSLHLIQGEEVRNLFEENKIQTIKSFVTLNSQDLELLGVKFHSDQLKLLDKQKQYLSIKKGVGGGLRTDLRGLDNDWKKVEEWRKNKSPFQKAQPAKKVVQLLKRKSFHVSRMSFNRQRNIQCDKGQIPLKIECTPRLACIKLACYNAFEEKHVEEIPEDVDVVITDNTRKKFISKIINDAQLESVTSIGYLCKVLKKDEDYELSMPSLKSLHNSHQTIESSSSQPKKEKDVINNKKSKRLFHTESTSSQSKKEKGDSDVVKAILKDLHEGPLCVRSEFPVRGGQPTPLWNKAGQQSSQPKYPGTEHVPMDPEIMFKKEDLATVDIQEEELTTKELIGKGQFGSVYRGLWKGLQVAIKQIPRGYGDPDISEVNICRRLRHPNIIMLFGCFISETDINIITNYVKGMNLGVALGLMKSRTHQPIDEKYNGFLVFFIAQGMSYLHEKEVIHQDLKPANIIVEDGSRKPIICDFGVSKLKDLAVTNMAGSNAGTLGYQHIEQLHGEKATTAVDVYSFGVIIGEVYSRQPAWAGKTFVQVKKAIEEGEYPTFPHIPPECQDLMVKCFKPAKQRATFMELLPDLESLSKIDVW